MSETGTANGKMVVNRSMSLYGPIAGPGDAMKWIFDFMAPDAFPEIAAATGAMLIGRRTYEVARRMRDADESGGKEYGGGWSGPIFVLSHRPPEPPDPADRFLTGDVGEAVATARGAAGGKNLDILGADVAGQCLRRGLVDEILRCTASAARRRHALLVPGPRQDRPGAAQAARSRRPSPSSGSEFASSPGGGGQPPGLCSDTARAAVTRRAGPSPRKC